MKNDINEFLDLLAKDSDDNKHITSIDEDAVDQIGVLVEGCEFDLDEALDIDDHDVILYTEEIAYGWVCLCLDQLSLVAYGDTRQAAIDSWERLYVDSIA